MATRKAVVSWDLRQAQVRSLYQAWIVRQSKELSGMASTKILKFHRWMVAHRPELLPVGKDPYQLLKSDLKGLLSSDDF
jgi:hypothetical protein